MFKDMYLKYVKNLENVRDDNSPITPLEKKDSLEESKENSSPIANEDIHVALEDEIKVFKEHLKGKFGEQRSE